MRPRFRVRFITTAGAAATGVLAVLALAGCSHPPAPDTGDLEPQDANEWSEQVLATSVSDDEFTMLHGTLERQTSLESTDVDNTLRPGNYTFHFACRGDGNITFTASNAGAALVEYAGPCTGDVEFGPFTATTSGATVTAVSSGEPIDWAFKLTAPKVR